MSVTVREKIKGSGVWYIFINIQGKRKAKKIGRDKKLAFDIAKKINAKLVLGEYNINESANNTPTFREYADKWLYGYIKGIRRDSTFQRYEGILKKYIDPAFGKIPVDELKRGQIKEFIVALHKKGMSASSICLVRDVLSGVLCQALDDEIIQINPVVGVLKKLNLDRSKRITVEPFNMQEMRLFLDTCQEFYPEYCTLFLTAFRTGLRLGEFLALEWGDIDWNSRYLWVRRSYKAGKVGKTKTGKERRVDLSNQLYDELLQLHTLRKAELAKDMMDDEVTGIIFTRDGKHIEQNFIRRTFERILSKAGLRSIRIHDIRHTFASLLLTNGESPVYVKEQMGHSSIQITVDIYGHLIPNSNRDAVNRLDDATLSNYMQPKTNKNPQPIVK